MTETSVARFQGPNQVESIQKFSTEQIDLIKRTICEGATNDELSLFMIQCKKTGLDPFSKQIYFQKYKNNNTGESKISIIVGIDGYRAIAGRTGLYAGSDDAIFDDETKPTKATVTVWKFVSGEKCAFTASARWDEYCPRPPKDHLWRKMPTTMLAKCAEGLALRKAFPYELSGLSNEEATQVIQAPAQTYQATTRQAPKVEKDTRLVSTDQITRLLAIGNEAGWDLQEIDSAVYETFSIDSKKDLKRYQYDWICDQIDSGISFDEFITKVRDKRAKETTPAVPQDSQEAINRHA